MRQSPVCPCKSPSTTCRPLLPARWRRRSPCAGREDSCRRSWWCRTSAAGPLSESPTFCSRLRELQQGGHQFFFTDTCTIAAQRTPEGTTAAPGALDGCLHRRSSPAARRSSATSPAPRPRLRLDAGEAALRAAGLRVDGFVPPAWAMPRWLVPVLSRRGYRFCEDHLRIYDPAGGTSRPSVVLTSAAARPRGSGRASRGAA